MSTHLPDVPLLGWGVPTDEQALEPLNIHSQTLAASLVVKTGPGVLFGFSVYNSKVSAQFVQVFDASILPADGAIPAAVFTVATVANLVRTWLPGRTFTTGCVICNSSTAATKTIGSADLFIDAQYL
jgi:hypothetical protein